LNELEDLTCDPAAEGRPRKRRKRRAQAIEYILIDVPRKGERKKKGRRGKKEVSSDHLALSYRTRREERGGEVGMERLLSSSTFFSLVDGRGKKEEKKKEKKGGGRARTWAGGTSHGLLSAARHNDVTEKKGKKGGGRPAPEAFHCIVLALNPGRGEKKKREKRGRGGTHPGRSISLPS